ncbi:Methyltransferase type 11 [Haloterrigena turkmenica DSM 5511]|uniref:Methyltransferase type 11 n=1 Tax=Haloterrigena turkmenica (strain ATCC 51198 / DSM 5511 / JCM 9101 / NCIMB 13204 / VKM B-1734 / 4k) TaxID=543526 RepID=D2RQM3_HALTV|nr:methyltransferase domain-containing protein [Haloterrigena turkmenica]ADB60354.1 Methyltransferase type 11 [Haloterrigena turkmenica DSM 5511]
MAGLRSRLRTLRREADAESAQEFYGRWADLYDLVARRTPGIPKLRRRGAAACRLEPGDTVVEMGCGTGANLPYLREQVGSEGTVVGIDFTGPVLERARELTAEYDNVHVVRGDATQPPLAADSDVDAVLATFVVGMLADPAGAVDDWCDLVGPGGRVVLANAASSREWYAPPVNAVFRAIVVLSTPPTTKLRYEDDPHRRLDEKIRAAHARLRERSTAVADERHVFGVVRLTGGKLE